MTRTLRINTDYSASQNFKAVPSLLIMKLSVFIRPSSVFCVQKSPPFKWRAVTSNLLI